MSRDINGNYTLPAGNPVAPDTLIESTWANSTMDDVGAALTDSLSRTGSGGMLVPFRIADGTPAAPGMAFVNDPDNGVYRAGTNDWWLVASGVGVAEITPGFFTIPLGVTLRVKGTLVEDNPPTQVDLHLTGDLIVDGTSSLNIIRSLVATQQFRDNLGANILLLTSTGLEVLGTQGLHNTRIKGRVVTVTSAANPAINTDITDIFQLTAQATAAEFTTNLTGAPADGDILNVQIIGTAPVALTWGAKFEASTVSLPTTTVLTNRLDVSFIWNAVTLKWRCIGVA